MDDLDGINVTMMPDGDGLDGSGTLVGEGVGADILSVGSIFAERYKIVSEGKAGGMGVVYKCLDLKLDQEATALKIIHPRLLHSDEALKRFHQEVTISRKLSHDGIVRVHDIGSYGGLEYFTMEWLDGVSLRDVIADRKKQHQPFSLEETYEIIHSLAEALQHAHRYTIHRDIKPENIMVEGGDLSKLKLMDFGIAKMMSVSQLATTSMQMGTPYYMAPEQKLDTGHVDKRADIYSVGVILFELLTLENTIGPELPSDLNPKIPRDVDDVFRQAVALKPEKRYGDVGELAAALLKIVSSERGRLQQLEEEALLKRKAELAEQKKREAADAEQRKREEELAEQNKRGAAEAERRKREDEEKEQEKKRLEAAAQQERLRNWESKTIKRSDVNIVDFGKFSKIAGIIAAILFIILVFTLDVISRKESTNERENNVLVQQKIETKATDINTKERTTIAVNADDHQTKQIKPDQQFNQEEIKEHGKLPQHPTLNSYNVSVYPSGTLRRGNPAKIITTIELCPSANQSHMDVREETIVLLPDKKTTYKNVQKYNEVNNGGAYTFNRSLVTKNMPGGEYVYRTNLYVNDKKLASRETSFWIE